MDSRKKVIDYLGSNLIKLGYADKGFIAQVSERELLSSTSFGGLVALPHCLKMEANKTGISVLLSDKSIAWGSHHVNIILMIAVKPKDVSMFSTVFQEIINLLSEPTNVVKLLRASTHQEFLATIESNLEE